MTTASAIGTLFIFEGRVRAVAGCLAENDNALVLMTVVCSVLREPPCKCGCYAGSCKSSCRSVDIDIAICSSVCPSVRDVPALDENDLHICQVLGSQVSVILATYVTAFLRH